MDRLAKIVTAYHWKLGLRFQPIEAMGLAIAAGFVFRLVHFLRVPSLWHDEAAMIVNVLNHDFGDILCPLLHHEASPPLFMLLEQAMRIGFGDSVPILRSCHSWRVRRAALTAFLARRILAPWEAVVAVALFAVSDRMLWHAIEAKPYAVDVLCSIHRIRLFGDARLAFVAAVSVGAADYVGASLGVFSRLFRRGRLVPRAIPGPVSLALA